MTEVVSFKKFRLIFRRSYFLNTIYSKKGAVTPFVSPLLFLNKRQAHSLSLYFYT
ncbi:hypothetical protein HMPREF1348_01714 [Enterococcus faecium 505]|uniref:Uncharacterized protein n=1 Tax=Enterococcus faecium 505 TaxID=1134806 RepID=J7CUN5_ENTFC|nr:hypothetical protein HMPREF1348_01714 [Enterococcus faecium 505]MBL5006379.1 hypothetical protein [Enterococcus lactis]